MTDTVLPPPSADALVRYIQLKEQLARLEAELEAVKAEAIRFVKAQDTVIEDDAVKVRYTSRPKYRFSPAITRMEEALKLAKDALKEEQEREIAAGLAVEDGRTEFISVHFKKIAPPG